MPKGIQGFQKGHKGYVVNYWLGKKRPEMSKENNPMWKGGVSSANKLIRSTLEYKNWRTAVFIRDNKICIFCGNKSREIQADHIKPFAHFPELRFDISNGRTLCKECHKKTKTYGSKKLLFVSS